MDLLDVAILALRIALVLVLYGFLVVVLRAAGSGLRVARPSSHVELTVLEAGGSGLSAGQVIEAFDGAVLGRAERVEVVVADSAVSAEHARLSRIGQRWVLADLGSTNGTLVNGQRVNGQSRLNNGDILILGGVRLKVVLR